MGRPLEDEPITSKQNAIRGAHAIRVTAAALLATAAMWWLPLPGRSASEARAEEAHGDVLTADSVCEAQRLRRLKEVDPNLQIEIPAEFDKQWPSYEACESHALAWDDEAPGPRQPIPFSHKHHAGLYEIDCQYCHSGTSRSRAAGVPSVEVCMGCHLQFPPEYDELEGIQILKQHWEEGTPIQWEQIHRLPEHVKFKHNRHIKADMECQTCHGQVQDMHKLYLVPDTIWWPWMMPAQKLEMGWCISCHRENGQQASQDCLTCHY